MGGRPRVHLHPAPVGVPEFGLDTALCCAAVQSAPPPPSLPLAGATAQLSMVLPCPRKPSSGGGVGSHKAARPAAGHHPASWRCGGAPAAITGAGRVARGACGALRFARGSWRCGACRLGGSRRRGGGGRRARNRVHIQRPQACLPGGGQPPRPPQGLLMRHPRRQGLQLSGHLCTHRAATSTRAQLPVAVKFPTRESVGVCSCSTGATHPKPPVRILNTPYILHN